MDDSDVVNFTVKYLTRWDLSGMSNFCFTIIYRLFHFVTSQNGQIILY